MAALGVAFFCASCGKKEGGEPPPPKDYRVSRETGVLPENGKGAALAKEQSTFLRRHADDPVEWLPWGKEAFEKAERENKLLLVSMGYATCPWSAKMQRESFQDPAVARFMNRHFVNVLVDREERPDISDGWLRYAVWRKLQPTWPLHVWITPKGLAVYCGSYFPARTESGKPSWSDILEHVATHWANDGAHLVKQAEIAVRDYGREVRALWKPGGPAVPEEANDRAYEKLRSGYDPVNGGFTGVPKFPRPHLLDFLMDYAVEAKERRFGRGEEAMEMVSTTLERMLHGGIVDQLDGGVFRYSRDLTWSVPQFEKMLYDQAYMADTLIRAGLRTGREDFTRAGRRTLVYAMTNLAHPEGGFFCAEGVDVFTREEGEEPAPARAGYVWRLEEIREAVAPEAFPLLKAVFGLDGEGNAPFDTPRRAEFAGLNLLRLEKTLEEAAESLALEPSAARTLFEDATARLLRAREERSRRMVDRKILTGWNGLMISSLARAGFFLGDGEFTRRAERTLDFVLKNLRNRDGSPRRAWLDGPSPAPACSEDYALLVQGLIDLYETTGNVERLKLAVELQDRQIALLWDAEHGGFFDGPGEGMILERDKSLDEGTELAAGAVSAVNLGRLAALTGRRDYQEKLKIFCDSSVRLLARGPALFSRFLPARSMAKKPALQIVVTGAPDAPDREAMLNALRFPLSEPATRLYRDGAAGQAWLEESCPALKELPAAPPGRTIVQICRDFQPLETLTEPGEVEAWLRRTTAAAGR